jgi:hypothetical protein
LDLLLIEVASNAVTTLTSTSKAISKLSGLMVPLPAQHHFIHVVNLHR